VPILDEDLDDTVYLDMEFAGRAAQCNVYHHLDFFAPGIYLFVVKAI
jgi:hypothetical protein